MSSIVLTALLLLAACGEDPSPSDRPVPDNPTAREAAQRRAEWEERGIHDYVWWVSGVRRPGGACGGGIGPLEVMVEETVPVLVTDVWQGCVADPEGESLENVPLTVDAVFEFIIDRSENATARYDAQLSFPREVVAGGGSQIYASSLSEGLPPEEVRSASPAPYGSELDAGTTYRYFLDTHCGADHLGRFNGTGWHSEDGRSLLPKSPPPERDESDQYVVGLLTLVSQDLIEYRVPGTDRVAQYRPTNREPAPCA